MDKETKDAWMGFGILAVIVVVAFNSCSDGSSSSSETLDGKSVTEVKMELCRSNPSIPQCKTDFPGFYK